MARNHALPSCRSQSGTEGELLSSGQAPSVPRGHRPAATGAAPAFAQAGAVRRGTETVVGAPMAMLLATAADGVPAAARRAGPADHSIGGMAVAPLPSSFYSIHIAVHSIHMSICKVASARGTVAPRPHRGGGSGRPR